MTCFILSVHDVEHTVPATGDVCVGYVVCFTTCLCMQAIQCFDCVSGADVCVGHAVLITTRLYMYKISDETYVAPQHLVCKPCRMTKYVHCDKCMR